MSICNPQYQQYTMVYVDTGIPLYTTTATQDEIFRANRNLRDNGLAARFFRAGTFRAPSICAGSPA